MTHNILQALKPIFINGHYICIQIAYKLLALHSRVFCRSRIHCQQTDILNTVRHEGYSRLPYDYFHIPSNIGLPEIVLFIYCRSLSEQFLQPFSYIRSSIPFFQKKNKH